MLLALLLTACAPEPVWYATCGDPVCGGYAGPFDGVPLCTTEALGATCATEGEECDPQDDCNALLRCTTEDPTAQTGGCPISRARYKRDIHYLSAEERSSMAHQALTTKLATWSYRWDPAAHPAHLGFVIDDQEGSPAVTADGDHVDLYGYTSLALAGVQTQQVTLDAQAAQISAQSAQITAQTADLAALRAQVALLSARLDALEPAH